jgi:hypothetical protein
MKRTFAALVILVTFLIQPLASLAIDHNFVGYLVDKKCSTTWQKSKGAIKQVIDHSKDCALSSDALLDGYVLYTVDGRWLPLDKKGNKLARETIALSSNPRGVRVSLIGELIGDTLKVRRILEVPEPSAKDKK